MKSFRALRKENKKLVHENKHLLKSISNQIKKESGVGCDVFEKIEEIKYDHRLLFRLHVQVRRFFGRKPMKRKLATLQKKKQNALRDVNNELKGIVKELSQ